AYMRGEPMEARRLAGGLCGGETPLQLRTGGWLLYGCAAMWTGDIAAWEQAVRELTALAAPPDMQREKELAAAILIAALHGQKYPEWLEMGDFTGLSPELFPAARWIYGAILYIKWKGIDRLALAGLLVSECRRDRSDICEIYLRLIAATAYHDHGYTEQAKKHIDEAAALALPLGFIAPFVEYRRMLLSVMDERIQGKYPETLSLIKKKMPPFLESWTRVYNGVWQHKIAEGLTPKEFEVCMLAARGMQRKEIAGRLGISLNSVGKYLSEAYGKLDVEKKEQLKRLIHP
ncbi:MAG: helix-turn-helix transcriptional regulator, partial [Syntrophomonadaceae bacterium]|nr:helix-turn-helix transcriptional regulator [Syntrophomonadaceae bacterium]